MNLIARVSRDEIEDKIYEVRCRAWFCSFNNRPPECGPRVTFHLSLARDEAQRHTIETGHRLEIWCVN